MSGYRKVYPVEGAEKYDKFLLSAFESYQEWTGAKLARSKNMILQKKQSKVSGPIKEPKKLLIKEDETIRSRCSSIPSLNTPDHEKSNHTVFERLSKPSIKKYKSGRPSKFPPLVYYDNLKAIMQKTNYPSSRLINGYIDTNSLYWKHSAQRQMVPKLFQFNFDKNNEGL